MSRSFQKVKIATQDKPASVAQIRALTGNLDFLRHVWRPTIWSQSWYISNAPASNLYFQTPLVYFPTNIKYLRAIFICTGTGAISFTVSIKNSIFDQTFTVSGTRSGAYTVVSDVLLPWFEYFTREEYQQASIGFQGNASGDLLYAGFFAAHEALDPPVNLFEVADSGHLRPVCEALNWLAQKPQFLGGWCGYKTGMECNSDSYSKYFDHFHLFDKSDDTISVDSGYVTSLLISSTAKTTTARTITARNTFRESGVTATYGPVTADNLAYLDVCLAGSTCRQESYSTTAGAESAVKTDLIRGAGDNAVYVDGWGLFCFTPALYQSRTQSTSGAVIDPDYFEVQKNAWIDTDNITAVGRALFNAVLLRSGQYTSWMQPPAGQSLSMTTTFADILRLCIVDDFLWLSPVVTKYTAPYFITAVIEASGSVTLETKLITSGGNTDTQALTLAAGRNYVSCSGSIALSATRGFDDLKLQLRDKNSSSTITVRSIVLQLRSNSTF